jgi:Ni/Fe-hydrogenase subunit HybB-like protein
VLSLEFMPAVLEKFGLHSTLKWLRVVMIPLVIAGVILSTLHQSSLGSLYLIVPQKLYPLWYTPLMPVLFYVSAICVGLAMTIFESWHSSRAFGKQLEMPLLASMARVLAVLLSFYLTMRFLDLKHREALGLLLVPRTETYMFFLEIALMAIPMILLFQARVRTQPFALYCSAVMVVLGFVTHRLNVSITGMEAAAGVRYMPKWTEITVTLAIIAAGFAIFRFAARHLPVFEEPKHEPLPVLEHAWQPVSAQGD